MDKEKDVDYLAAEMNILVENEVMANLIAQRIIGLGYSRQRLVQLDRSKVRQTLSQLSGITDSEVIVIADVICNKFGTYPLLTVDELEGFLMVKLTECENKEGDFDISKLAQAIHARLTQ